MTLPNTSATLQAALSLTLPPIGVCLLDAVPEGIPAFSGRAAAGCQFWEKAATQVFATVAADHDLCAIGTFTHNLDATPAHEKDRGDALKVFADLGYVRPEDLPLIPALARRPQVVLYGPLADLPVAPDAVLLFVDANQTLILTEATQQVEMAIPPALGRPACAIVPQAVNTGRGALSLGCCGARVYVDALKHDVSLFAIPGAKLEAYVERISALAKANGILTQFHTLRRQDVEAGQTPTIEQSLARLGA
jgi:uncharacterized protein (DUF169 family)